MGVNNKNSEYKKPGYYVRKRFLKNKLALFGSIIIVLSIVIAVFGYSIMPDKTPYANESMLEITRKEPGFSVKILKRKKDYIVPQRSIFGLIMDGQENPYALTPIVGTPRIEGDSVHFIVYPGIEKRNKRSTLPLELSLPLVRVVKTLYVGPSNKKGFEQLPTNYYSENGIVHYLDYNQEELTITQSDLEKEFWLNNIEERHFLLGTDKIGRDVLSRLMYGARISLVIGTIAVLISLLVGVSFGAISGFFGGMIDNIIMWIMTVMWSIPTIMLVVAIRLALQSDQLWVTFVAVGLTMWVEIARVVRGQIIAIKEKTFVEAARALGFSNTRIIFLHILPNIMGPLVVISASNFASAILIEAGLSFLGLGGPPTMPSWGIMIKEGLSELTPSGHWHLIFWPCLCISLMVLAFNLLGNGLRDAYDPQNK